MISSPTLGYRVQLPNRRKIFGIYALTLLMYTVADFEYNFSIEFTVMREEMQLAQVFNSILIFSCRVQKFRLEFTGKGKLQRRILHS